MSSLNLIVANPDVDIEYNDAFNVTELFFKLIIGFKII
jgi:hypothetical protein